MHKYACIYFYHKNMKYKKKNNTFYRLRLVEIQYLNLNRSNRSNRLIESYFRLTIITTYTGRTHVYTLLLI